MSSTTYVTPRMHDWAKIESAIISNYLDSEELLQSLAFLATNGLWRKLWHVADLLSREVSILFDSEDHAWVDIGTSGMVRLNPPVGAKIAFNLWIHTHPYDAYWAATDQDTLSAYSPILQEALVLGHDHLKKTVKNDGTKPPLGSLGPLKSWTSEPIVRYDEMEVEDGG